MNMAANYRELPATGAGKPSLHRNAKKSEKNANCSDFSHFSKKISIFGCFAVFFLVFHFFPFQILSGQNPVSPVKPIPGNSWKPMGTLSPWDECMASKKNKNAHINLSRPWPVPPICCIERVLFPKKCSKPTTEDFTVALNKPKNMKGTSKKTICFSSSQKPIISGKTDRQFPEVG